MQKPKPPQPKRYNEAFGYSKNTKKQERLLIGIVLLVLGLIILTVTLYPENIDTTYTDPQLEDKEPPAIPYNIPPMYDEKMIFSVKCNADDGTSWITEFNMVTTKKYFYSEKYLSNTNEAFLFEVDIDSGKIIAIVPELPGCTSQGWTEAEAYKNIKEAMKEWIEADPVE